MSDNVKPISSARESIGVGTVVELKSGGPPMTVTLRAADMVQVIWHNADGDMYRDLIPISSVRVRG